MPYLVALTAIAQDSQLSSVTEVMLPPLYQRPPGAEIPAMGFSVTLKSLVKANLLPSWSGGDIDECSLPRQTAARHLQNWCKIDFEAALATT
jgi:hypothetical protein